MTLSEKAYTVYSNEYEGFIYNLTHFKMYDSMILTLGVNKNRTNYQKHIFILLYTHERSSYVLKYTFYFIHNYRHITYITYLNIDNVASWDIRSVASQLGTNVSGSKVLSTVHKSVQAFAMLDVCILG
jgi:hypothetical protein